MSQGKKSGGSRKRAPARKRRAPAARVATRALPSAAVEQFEALIERAESVFAHTGLVSPLIGLAAPSPTPSPQQVEMGVEMLCTQLSTVAEAEPDSLAELSVKVDTPMDPRLQLAIANHRTGKEPIALALTTGDELPVVARVASVAEWSALPDVFPGSAVGETPDGSWIVTGRVPIQRIEAVRAAPTVLSLKGAQPIRPALSATRPALGVVDGSLPAGTSPDGGKGVVVGIVDYGCDFIHRNFRLANGNTRLLAIWHQAGVTMPDSPFGYGRVYAKAEINAALKSADPYTALGYGPRPDSPFSIGTHGTHVMDIAAGNGFGSTQPGIAPKADIVFVEIAANDIPWEGPESVQAMFGDSVQLLEAVRFIFDTAGNRPCVCNLSLGTNGGPHDGTSLVEQGLDAIVKEKPNRAIVIAAGNAQLHGIHTQGTVPAAGTKDILWRNHHGHAEFELWYPSGSRVEITLLAPDGTEFGPVLPNDNQSVGPQGQIAIFIASRLNDPNNRDNVIGIWLAGGLSPGDWTVRLRSLDGKPVDYHAWIERNDTGQSSFVAPVPSHTLGSISTGQKSVVVGSYDAHKPTFPLSSFSSCGPTRDGRNKPEVSAPGQNVQAARSRTLNGVVRKSGTSMAAPAVTGLIALILAEALRKKQPLAIDELRNKLVAAVLRDPPTVVAGGWDPFYGNGRANGMAV